MANNIFSTLRRCERSEYHLMGNKNSIIHNYDYINKSKKIFLAPYVDANVVRITMWEIRILFMSK